MDPQLLLEQLNGTASQSVLAASENETLYVIVKISNLEAWQKLKGIQFGSTTSSSEGRWIVTAQMPRCKISEIRKQPFVDNIEFNLFLCLNSLSESTAMTSDEKNDNTAGMGNLKHITALKNV